MREACIKHGWLVHAEAFGTDIAADTTFKWIKAGKAFPSLCALTLLVRLWAYATHCVSLQTYA